MFRGVLVWRDGGGVAWRGWRGDEIGLAGESEVRVRESVPSSRYHHTSAYPTSSSPKSALIQHHPVIPSLPFEFNLKAVIYPRLSLSFPFLSFPFLSFPFLSFPSLPFPPFPSTRYTSYPSPFYLPFLVNHIIRITLLYLQHLGRAAQRWWWGWYS